MNDRGNPLFGDWSGIERGRGAEYIPTPVGKVCLWCECRIREGDSGEMLLRLGDAVLPEPIPVHYECMLLGQLGHVYGVCSCTDYANAESPREAARELAKRVAGDPARAMNAVGIFSSEEEIEGGPAAKFYLGPEAIAAGVREYPGYRGAFTRNRAPGAWSNGARIVKVRAAPGDRHEVGARGTILGSVGYDAVGLGYFVEWDDSPGLAVAVLDDGRIAPYAVLHPESHERAKN